MVIRPFKEVLCATSAEPTVQSRRGWWDTRSTARWSSMLSDKTGSLFLPSAICAFWRVGPLCPQTPSSWSFLSAWGRLGESAHTGCWPCPGTWSGWGRTATGTCCPRRDTAETETSSCVSPDPTAISAQSFLLMEHITQTKWYLQIVSAGVGWGAGVLY